MEKRFPSELKERQAEFKAQAQEALKERDSDRWLAAAKGFFAMGAGTSPYALKNFAEGAGAAVKDFAEAQKEWRKGQDLRQKAEREEFKIDRLERIQKFSAADKARTRVEDIKRQAEHSHAMFEARLEELAIKRISVGVEREKAAATREGAKEYRDSRLKMEQMQRFNGAVETAKKNIMSVNKLGALQNPNFEADAERRAIELVIARNPEFAGLAGVTATQAPAPTRAPKQPLSAFDGT